jgi:hypothetical protein
MLENWNSGSGWGYIVAMSNFPAWLGLIVAWIICARVVVPIMLYELARGRVWPEGSPTMKGWALRAALCPEWAWLSFWKAYQETHPAPLTVYLHKRDLHRTDFS